MRTDGAGNGIGCGIFTNDQQKGSTSGKDAGDLYKIVAFVLAWWLWAAISDITRRYSWSKGDEWQRLLELMWAQTRYIFSAFGPVK
jgi:hypothetical protein